MHGAISYGYVRALRPSYFGIFLVFLLSGYALLGRGFAYLGAPPLFVGEIGLILAAGTIAYRFYPGLLRTPVTWLLFLFMMWGAYRTVPYVGAYGVDALRDGVVWGYAIYSLAVATIVLRFRLIEKVIELYGWAIPFFLVLGPILLLVSWTAGDSLPRWPWAQGVTIVNQKPGDLTVHFAGVLAFLALDLSTTVHLGRLIALWFAGVAPAMFVSRGAFLTVACVMVAAVFLRPRMKYFYVGAFLAAVLFLLYIIDFELDLGWTRNRRTISVAQLVENVVSIFFRGDGTDAELAGTAKWREIWWSKIVAYTVFGDYFWSGKGFGVNLADVDGFQLNAERTLRSPHSIHMTILGRAGVPGILLWATLQLSFAATLFLNYLSDRHAGRNRLANVQLWILLYWSAFIVNASFDVYLEGPQGGIWFWCVFGFGLALIVARSEIVTASRRHERHRAAIPRNLNTRAST